MKLYHPQHLVPPLSANRLCELQSSHAYSSKQERGMGKNTRDTSIYIYWKTKLSLTVKEAGKVMFIQGSEVLVVSFVKGEGKK